MRFATGLLLTGFVALAVFASPLPVPAKSVTIRRRQAQHIGNGKAAYIITNDPKQNTVVAMSINEDGTLGDAFLTATGGCGSVALDAKGKPAVPDALVGQSALTIAGNNIFAVNAGSNTVSMLAISPNDPLSLTLVGQPATLPGTFPNTVAASVKNSLVCVGTTGSQAGISCANFDAQNGIGQMDALRPFDLGQTDPPAGPTNTVSQTFFSEDESMLFTTVKGDPTVNKTGFLSVFHVQASQANLQARRNWQPKKQGQQDPNAVDNNPKAGCSAQPKATNANPAILSTRETRSSPAGTAVLFGSQPIPNTNNSLIFATDASFGAGILSLSPASAAPKAILLASTPIPDQKATCWSTISPPTRSAFVTDVGRNRIVEMNLADASILSTIDLSKETASSADPGLIDIKAAGGFVYALSPGDGKAGSEAAVSVVNVRTKRLVQHARLGGIGVGATAQGMAVLA